MISDAFRMFYRAIDIADEFPNCEVNRSGSRSNTTEVSAGCSSCAKRPDMTSPVIQESPTELHRKLPSPSRLGISFGQIFYVQLRVM